MKQILTIFIVLCGIRSNCQDYSLHINDTTLDVSLDKKYEIILDGKKISFSFSSYDTLKYDDSLFSFLYSKEFKTSKHQVDGGVEQVTIITAEGNGIIVQKYSSLNPTKLNELMLNEITKESIEYGYNSKRDDYKRTIKSEQTIDVSRAILTYKDDIYTYEVASIGKKDAGVMIITILTNDKNGQGKKIIDLLWNSFVFK